VLDSRRLSQRSLELPSIRIRIRGVPYAHRKTGGRADACAKWTEAVETQTRALRQVTGACRLRVTFFLPADKYPTDFPFGMDLDNLLKRFFDALQKTVFRDVTGKDSCVTELEARKVQVPSAEDAGADLEIVELHGAHE
jgi:Holliday junction resolvase RusA-like endonuclease